MKKFVSLILALTLCVALAVPAMAAETRVDVKIVDNFKSRFSISLNFSDIISKSDAKIDFFRPDTVLIRVYQGTKMSVDFKDKYGTDKFTRINLLPAVPNGAYYIRHDRDVRDPIRYASEVDSITFDKIGYWFLELAPVSTRDTPIVQGLYVVIDVEPTPYYGSLSVGFRDVYRTDYFADAVTWAAGHGVTTGVEDGFSFAPAATLSRAEAVTFLWRSKSSPAPQTTENPFTDVVEGSYYYDAVLWAVENGITTGVSADRFNVDGYVSRGEMLTFLWRAAGKPNDIGGKWYESAENWARANNLMRWDSVSYQTAENCPRCDAVYYIYCTK